MPKKPPIIDVGSAAHWAVLYNSNSSNPRSRRWYYIARVILVDGQWHELYYIYRHQPYEHGSTGSSLTEIRKYAAERGYPILPGVFSRAGSPRPINQIVWSLS